MISSSSLSTLSCGLKVTYSKEGKLLDFSWMGISVHSLWKWRKSTT